MPLKSFNLSVGIHTSASSSRTNAKLASRGKPQRKLLSSLLLSSQSKCKLLGVYPMKTCLMCLPQENLLDLQFFSDILLAKFMRNERTTG